MTNEKILQAVHSCRAIIKPFSPRTIRCDPTKKGIPGNFPAIEHLAYMCEEIPVMVADGKRDKAFRWLGFLQGVIWTLGLSSLQELKRMNMPDAEEVVTE